MKADTYEANSTEGMALIKKYNITAVPTVLYSPDASYYQDFDKVWLYQNSTIASDGWHVFRSFNVIAGKYQNLSAG